MQPDSPEAEPVRAQTPILPRRGTRAKPAQSRGVLSDTTITSPVVRGRGGSAVGGM